MGSCYSIVLSVVFFPSIYDIRITHFVSFVNDSCYTVRKNDDTCLEGSVVLVWLAVCYFMRNLCCFDRSQLSHVKQELLTLPEYPGSSHIFSGVRVARSFVLYVMFCRSLFVLFLLAIVLSVLRFRASNHSFGIFKFSFIHMDKGNEHITGLISTFCIISH